MDYRHIRNNFSNSSPLYMCSEIAQNIWNQFIAQKDTNVFFSMSGKECFVANLSRNTYNTSGKVCVHVLSEENHSSFDIFVYLDLQAD
uniref:Uncharacterized protein n=1 Tax=Populus trichocarpa TaxID=3694 RepID=A0A2K2BBB3_POPTR